MSDRVAIIGGSVVGRDHFPFAVTEDEPAYPTSGSIGFQCALFYVVRTWIVNVDLAPVGATEFGPFFLDATDSGSNITASRESDLVTHPEPYWTDDGSHYLRIAYGADGTLQFSIKLYESQGEVVSNPEWNDSISFGDDFEYSYHAAPIEYWPYATTSGDPVYDTSTGAQINDPLS